MRRVGRVALVMGLLLGLAVLVLAKAPVVTGQPVGGPELSGHLVDEQAQPVAGAAIAIHVDGDPAPVAETHSLRDGSWFVTLPTSAVTAVHVDITHAHYAPYQHDLSPHEIEQLRVEHAYSLQAISLAHRITPGFWAAGLTFVGVLVIIALEKLRNALAALAGISAVFLITFVGGALAPSLYVFDFERALAYIDWEVIFLVLGMMIVVGIVEGTGIFQWLAFTAYRMSRGRVSLLMIILIGITSAASALLDNVTTMLLVAPITIQIALALDVDPLALLVPEILASNVAGISTLIGTPTNIMIGAYAGIGFNDFLVNQMLGALLTLGVMTIACLVYYRKEIRKHDSGLSPVLYERLRQNAAIKDPVGLRRSGIVFGGMLIFFALGDSLHLVPAVTALVGATLLLLWVEPNIEKMLGAVDWTTLVFFMALFMLVGAIQEVGILSLIAAAMSNLIGGNLLLGILVLVLGSGLLSFVVASVPLTAALLPVVGFLSGGIPGAESKVLYYALSIGVTLGGNGLLIGGESNLMTAGIAERAGYPIRFNRFARIGVPVALLTLLTGAAWLFLRFVVLGG